MQEILLDLENHEIIEILKFHSGIQNKNNNFEKIEIKSLFAHYTENELKFLHSLFNSLEKFMPCDAIRNHYLKIFSVRTKNTPTSTGKKNLPEQDETDPPDVSGDQSRDSNLLFSELTGEELKKELGLDLSKNFASRDHQSIDVEVLYEQLMNTQWDYSIWVSEINRDHNIQTIGKLDPEGSTFQKIVTGLKVIFHGNTWNTIIYSKEGLSLSSSMNSNGFIRVWINENLSLAQFFKNLQDKLLPCKLSILEFKELIETIGITEKDDDFNNRRRLFHLITENDKQGLKDYLMLIREKGMQQLETANLIGPAPIIAQYFNKACLVCKNILYKGKYVPILIKVDKSKGPFEIEFIGPEGPTRRVQDAVSKALSVANSLGEFDRALEDLLKVGCANNDLLAKNNAFLKIHHEKLEDIENRVITLQEQATSELTSRYHDIELQQGILETLSKQGKDLGEHYEKTSETLENAVNGFNNAARSLNNTRDQINDKLETIQYDLDLMKTDLAHQLHLILEKTIFNHHEISTKVNDLEKNINSNIDAKFSDFHAIINEKFEHSRSDRKENLQVILEKLNEKLGPAIENAVDNAMDAAAFIVRNNIIARLISDLQAELGKSRSSIYSYLKQLWEKGLLKRIIVKSHEKGRPKFLFVPLSFIKNLQKNKPKK